MTKGKSSLIRFRLMVDATGKPSSCHVQEATLTAAYMELTCRVLMQRARFVPALDAKGQPVVSYYTNAVNWLSWL